MFFSPHSALKAPQTHRQHHPLSPDHSSHLLALSCMHCMLPPAGPHQSIPAEHSPTWTAPLNQGVAQGLVLVLLLFFTYKDSAPTFWSVSFDGNKNKQTKKKPDFMSEFPDSPYNNLWYDLLLPPTSLPPKTTRIHHLLHLDGNNMSSNPDQPSQHVKWGTLNAGASAVIPTICCCVL